MPGKIFINYRRAESLKDARHLATLLDNGAFRGRVFIDLKGLAGAPDWLHELERQVAASEAMIAVICPGWADVRDEDGRPRIGSDSDFVRFELAEAFRRGIPVIPVLVDGARMPRGSQLPENLLLLTRPQAEFLRAESFDDDADKIALRVQAEIDRRRKRGWPGWAVALVAGIALACGAGLGPIVTDRFGWSQPAATDAEAAARTAKLRAQLADAEGAARATQTALLRMEQELTNTKLAVGQLTTERDLARQEADAHRTLAEGRANEMSAIRAEANRLADLLAAAENAREAATVKVDELQKQVAALQAQIRTRTEEPAPPKPASDATQHPTFRDCPDCPEMVVVPAGTFTMGSSRAEISALIKDAPNFAEAWQSEGPTRTVTIAKPFAVGKFEVTFDEWVACVNGDGCQSNKSPSDQGWGKGRRPVINVSWNDAKDYVAWLTRRTNKRYRLLSEAEWEYSARAGTTTRYSWGDDIGTGHANCATCGSEWDNSQTAPVGSFKANAFGLHDMHGNVREWCEDNLHKDYAGNPPTDGSAWSGGDSRFRILRSGPWSNHPRGVRSAVRFWRDPAIRQNHIGFRVARTL